MTEERKKCNDYRLLILIVAQKLDEKAQELFSRRKLAVQYHIYAKGTASGEFADMFGLGGIDKTTIACTLPKSKADQMLVTLREELYLGAPNTGVAFTVPLSGGSMGLIRWMDGMRENEEASKGEETMDGKYAVIMAFVNQGFSEEVMAAAKSAGAGGGTVFHSRRVDNEEAHRYWGVSFQEEREVVLILAKKENKCAIMKAIGDSCGLQSEARGIVVSLPVDEVTGLKKDEG